MNYVTIETERSGYSPEQCGSTMTVQEMIDYLSQFDGDSKIYFSNDNGYTFGSIHDYNFEEVNDDGDDDDE